MTDGNDAPRIIRPDDPDVPAEIRAMWPQEVPELHIRGPFPMTKPAIAIVGTTTPSPIARGWAYECAREAARCGWLVVSGMAAGIDRAAHEGALDGDGITVAVVANGLDRPFPPGSEAFTERIISTGGSVVSIAPPGTMATSAGLLLRNRFTSAFADIVLAVQARGRGGTLATTRHATRQRKLLATFLPPAQSSVDEWEGNRALVSSDAPWRDRDLVWRPAIALSDPSELPELFAHWQSIEPVDVPPAVFETRPEKQLRLLE